MGFKKILSIVFQIPVWLILVGALITSIFAWLLKIQDINFWTPLILLIAIILYIIGRWFIKEENELNLEVKNEEVENQKYYV